MGGDFVEVEKLIFLQSFALAWHWANSAWALVEAKGIYKLLGEKEYARLKANSENLSRYFYPQLDGKYAINLFMNNFICPLPVANHVFCENALKNATRIGTKQLIVINQGLSTQLYDRKNLKVFDINNPDLSDIVTALNKLADFDSSAPAFAFLGSMPIFTDKRDFKNLLDTLGAMFTAGSSVVLSYGDEGFFSDISPKGPAFIKEISKINQDNGYSYSEMEKLLSSRGFLIYEHITSNNMQQQYFENHNALNMTNLTAIENVNYILAVKKEPRK